MFTTGAFFLIAIIAWLAQRHRRAENASISGLFDDDQVRQAVVHAREDIRLIAYLLGGIIFMLGIVADRLP